MKLVPVALQLLHDLSHVNRCVMDKMVGVVEQSKVRMTLSTLNNPLVRSGTVAR